MNDTMTQEMYIYGEFCEYVCTSMECATAGEKNKKQNPPRT